MRCLKLSARVLALVNSKILFHLASEVLMSNIYRPGVIAYDGVLVSFHSSYFSNPHYAKLNSSGLLGMPLLAKTRTLTDLSECIETFFNRLGTYIEVTDTVPLTEVVDMIMGMMVREG